VRRVDRGRALGPSARARSRRRRRRGKIFSKMRPQAGKGFLSKFYHIFVIFSTQVKTDMVGKNFISR
jgi:hypothetical protein